MARTFRSRRAAHAIAEENHARFIPQRLPRDRALDGVFRVFDPRARAVDAPLLADRRRPPVALHPVGKQIRIRDRAPVPKRLRQVQQRPLIAQMRLETVVQQPQPFQLEVLPQHHRPRHEAEQRQPQHDRFVDRSRPPENFNDVGGRENG